METKPRTLNMIFQILKRTTVTRGKWLEVYGMHHCLIIQSHSCNHGLVD